MHETSISKCFLSLMTDVLLQLEKIILFLEFMEIYLVDKVNPLDKLPLSIVFAHRGEIGGNIPLRLAQS